MLMRGAVAILLVWSIIPYANLQGQAPSPHWESRLQSRFALETVGAAAGAVGTSIAFAYLGAAAATSGGDSPGLLETFYGAMIGSVVGGAIGASVVGDLTHDSGTFGSALLGGFSGLILFVMAMPSLDADYASFYVALWGLPAVGAVTGYALSRNEGDNRLLGVRFGETRISVKPNRDGVAVGATVTF
jgi:hypothetical protein